MPDNKKPPEPEVETSSSGNQKGAPPNQIDNVTYKVAGEESQVSPPIFHPPKVVIPAGYKPFKNRTQQLPSGKDLLIRLPDGRFVTQYEAERFYGTIPKDAIIVERAAENLDTENTVEAIRQPDGSYKVPNIDTSLQTKPESRMATRQGPQIAQRTHIRIQPPITTPEQSAWEEVDEKRRRELAELETAAKQLGSGQKVIDRLKKDAQDKAQQAKQRPVPKKDLPIIARMYGELKNFYYQGYAQSVEEAKYTGLQDAASAQKSQFKAMQYGMSSLMDLHRGLDLASWEFFFNTLGPLGDYIRKFHRGEIDFNMTYYGGRAWWSPNRIEYLFKNLPEEKAVEFLYDATMKTIYMVGKFTKNNWVGMAYVCDQNGNPKKEYAFVPLVKLQKGVNAIGGFLDRLTTEKSVWQKEKMLEYFKEKQNEELRRALSSREKRKIINKYKLVFKAQNSNINIAKSEVNKKWLGPVFNLFSTDPNKRASGRDIVLSRMARTVFGKTGKRLRNTHHDPLTWFALIIGGLIYDLTVGNLINLIAEKITSNEIWMKVSGMVQEFFDRPIFENLRASWLVTKDFAGALPSLNTVAGAYLGGTIGQNIATALGINPQIGFAVGTGVGGGFGWGYQWGLNMAKNQTLMDRMLNYTDITKDLKDLNDLHWQAVKRWGVNSEQALNFKNEIEGLTKEKFNLSRGLYGEELAPGRMMRFANWLNRGTWEVKLFGQKISIPTGQLFRLPLKGLAVSQMLSPFEADIRQFFPQYGAWVPPVLEYFWEIKGPLWNFLTEKTWNFLRFNNIQAINSRLELEEVLKLEPQEVSGMPSFRQFTQMPNTYLMEGSEKAAVVQPRGWYQRYINFRSGLTSSLRMKFSNFMFEHTTFKNIFNRVTNYFKDLNKVGLTNFAGFIIGWELAGLIPGAPFWLAPALGIAGWFGINPALTLIGRGLNALGLITDGTLLPNLFSAGFWLGQGISVVLGFFGISLPWYFPIATGIGLAILPQVLVWTTPIVYNLVPFVGNVMARLAIGLVAGEAAELAGVFVALGVGSVALMTIFIVFVVGSAFWVPIQEQLQGITPESPCFKIGAPVLNQNPDEKPFFQHNETKKICWTTTINQQELYQGPIIKSKTWTPWDKFKIIDYKVTIQSPNGNAEWDNRLGTSGNYQLDKNNNWVDEQIATGNPIQPYVIQRVTNGVNFSITPPKDTSGHAKQQIMENLNNIANSKETRDEMLAAAAVQQAAMDEGTKYLLNKELSFLQSISVADSQTVIANKAASTLQSVNQSIQTNKSSDIKSGATRYIAVISGANGIISACRDWNKNKQALPDLASPYPNVCDQIVQSLSINSLTDDATKFFNSIQNQTPEARTATIQSIQKQIQQIEASANFTPKQIEMINKVKDAYPTPPIQNDAQLQTKLSQIADSYVDPNNPGYYLPSGSTITICLDVNYSGEDSASALVSEKDSATLPIFGPVSTINCQAELPTFFNRGPKDKIQWPTGDTPKISQPYRFNAANPGDTTNHTGTDIPGSFGEPVEAVTAGTVVSTGYEANGFGNYAIVQGSNGEYYIYGHLGSEVKGNEALAFGPNIIAGAKLNQGDLIGSLGNSGNATGPHLHFGISTQSSVKSFWNNSNTTVNPCLFFANGCPAP